MRRTLGKNSYNAINFSYRRETPSKGRAEGTRGGGISKGKGFLVLLEDRAMNGVHGLEAGGRR